ncbi:DNA-binding protein [Streptomyces sp. F-3]|uniref:helix-turn-helix transcriptional regulator n=1 Tax=Streptomyces sp. F-3 TaxID=1840095 RepID=UPI0007C3BA1D|nr:helix-turn-helix domain-containing protein [Streptomyces sp. F-3]GAT81075.1 DNA-binding protein [Streptomyces sp. F-3]
MAARTRYLTTKEVAARFRAAESTVRYWRLTGFGPKGIKVGRRVLYPEDAVDAWEAEQIANEEKRAA